MASESILTPEITKTDVKPNIGIPDKSREGVIEILNSLLCDEYVLYTKTRKYHWNVVGPRFHPLHVFFREQYEALDKIVDEVAERARQLGGKSLGTLDEFIRHSRLHEDPNKYPPAQSMIANLLKDHEKVIQQIRKDADDADEKYHDMGTNDFLIATMEAHEKMAWMLRAHLEAEDI
jgi:starvation-inducible DNA-binding protein